MTNCCNNNSFPLLLSPKLLPAKAKSPSVTLLDAITSFLSITPTPTTEQNPEGLVGISTIHRNANPTGKPWETYQALVELEKRGSLIVNLRYINFEESLLPEQRSQVLTPDVTTVIEVLVKSLISPPAQVQDCRFDYLRHDP